MTLGAIPLAPVVGAALVLAVRRRPALAGTLAVGTVAATLVLAIWSVATDVPAPAWGWQQELPLSLELVGFSRVMAVLIPVIAGPVVTYAAFGERADGRSRLLAWLLGFVGAMELLVLAADFLTLLVGWELVGACSWALIGHEWRDRERPLSATSALLTTRVGDLGLYLAGAAAFAGSGSLAFSALGEVHGSHLHVVAAGLLVAAAAKSAQLPFAPWLFSAMAGPTPASALLHSATMVAAGAYALIRLWPWLESVGWLGPALIGVGLATAVAGGVVAALHSDIKKALAGSTSSQYGLMFLAVGAGSTAAAGAQLVTHAAFKSLLFLAAGVAIHAAGSPSLERLRLGRGLPWVAGLVAVGALALAAVPPLGGAYSKEAVLAAAAGRSFWLGLGVVASGALTAFYAGRLLLLAYGPGPRRPFQRPARAAVAALATLAGLSILLGLLWLPEADGLVERATLGTLTPAASWMLPASLTGLIIAAAACLLLWRRSSLVDLGLTPGAREPTAAWLGIPVAAEGLIVRPISLLATSLARFDDRVVDAGVRAAAAFGRVVSRGSSRWGEAGFDGLVEASARATVRTAELSRLADDRGVDGVVEHTAGAVLAAGGRSRRLQTGLVHHYYLIAGGGLVAFLALILLWR